MRNCLIYLVDALRYDAIENSYERTSRLREWDLKNELETPSMNRLLDSGVKLPHLHSTYASTPPSVASLLTGQYPREHHLYGYFRSLNSNVRTLADYFRDMGYHTLMMNGHRFFAVNGIRDRFDEYLTGNTEQLIKRIKNLNRQGERVFAFFHSFDVHDPYLMSYYLQKRDHLDPAIEYANDICKQFGYDYQFDRDDAFMVKQDRETPLRSGEKMPLWNFHLNNITKHYEKDKKIFPDPLRARAKFYTEGINIFDEKQLPPLIDFLFDSKQGEETLLFFTSDHGERPKISENGANRFHHVGKPVEEIIRVPGIFINLENHRLNLRDWELTSQVDIAPTILSLFDYNYSDTQFSGMNLLHPISDERVIYADYNQTRSKSFDSEDPVGDLVFPLPGVTTWQAIISSGGVKFYRVGDRIMDSDFDRPLDNFLKIVCSKLMVEWTSDEEVNDLKKDFSEDNYETRKEFVESLERLSKKAREDTFSNWKELYNWKQDLHETDNILDSNLKDSRYEQKSQNLEKKLDGRFPFSLDIKATESDKIEDTQEKGEELTEALEGLGYI